MEAPCPKVLDTTNTKADDVVLGGAESAWRTRGAGAEFVICSFRDKKEVLRAAGPYVPVLILGHVTVEPAGKDLILGIKVNDIDSPGAAVRLSGLSLQMEGSSAVRKPSGVWRKANWQCTRPVPSDADAALQMVELAKGQFAIACFPWADTDDRRKLRLEFDAESVGTGAKERFVISLDKTHLLFYRLLPL